MGQESREGPERPFPHDSRRKANRSADRNHDCFKDPEYADSNVSQNDSEPERYETSAANSGDDCTVPDEPVSARRQDVPSLDMFANDIEREQQKDHSPKVVSFFAPWTLHLLQDYNSESCDKEPSERPIEIGDRPLQPRAEPYSHVGLPLASAG